MNGIKTTDRLIATKYRGFLEFLQICHTKNRRYEKQMGQRKLLCHVYLKKICGPGRK